MNEMTDVERTEKFFKDILNISEYIKNNAKVSFEQVIEHAKTLNISEKNYVVDILQHLKDNFVVTEFNKKIIHIQDLPFVEKYVQSNINQFVWADDKDTSNKFGLSFDPSFELLSVSNKKDVFLKSKWEGKIVEDEGQKTFVAIKSLEALPHHILVIQDDRGNYRILNNQVGYTIPQEILKEKIETFSQEKQIKLEHDSIFEIKNHGSQFDVVEFKGLLRDKGIETKLIHEMIELKKEPVNSSIQVKELSVSPELKDIPMITIDAISTKDRDDGLFARYTYDSNGQKNGYELFVFIANVSKYVQKNDEQDLQAQKLTSSVYLANQTLHMLDDHLAQEVGSLNPGLNRDTLYMRATFNLKGQLTHSEFKEGVIHSAGAITYDDVDRILKSENPVESTIGSVNLHQMQYNDFDVMLKLKNIIQDFSKIEQNIHVLNELNHAIEQTPERKYWFVDSPEYKIGENGKIESLYLDNRNAMDSHKIVENMMKITNIEAAKLIEAHFPKLGLYRNQVSPSDAQADDMSISVKPKSAFYSQDNQGHWALNQAQYVHFTSPLRRLSDLVQHRVVRAIINKEEAPYTPDEMNDLSEKINYKQYVYKQAYIKEENLLMPQYLQSLVESKKLANKYDVVDVTERGVVLRNKQLIEHFIPHFKVDRIMSKVIAPYLPQLKSSDDAQAEMKVNEKIEMIKHLNQSFDVKGYLDRYHWLSDRKQVSYKYYERNDDKNNQSRNQERKMRM